MRAPLVTAKLRRGIYIYSKRMGNKSAKGTRPVIPVQRISCEENVPLVVGPKDAPGAVKMRIIVVSDTHKRHRELGKLPDGDVLIHCGDWSNWATTQKDTQDFNSWMGEQQHPVKICVSGNHEISLFGKKKEDNRKTISEAIYLEGDGFRLNGFTFWGGPWNKDRDIFKRANAFSVPVADCSRHWSKIPCDVDVLITHSPPYGILDRKEKSGKVTFMGCTALFDNVVRACPTLHLFGHCHDASGIARASIDIRDVHAARLAAKGRLFNQRNARKGDRGTAENTAGSGNPNGTKSVREEENEDRESAATGGEDKQSVGWTCGSCTFFNQDGSFLMCEVCGAERPFKIGNKEKKHDITFVNAANKYRMFPVIIDIYKVKHDVDTEAAKGKSDRAESDGTA